MRRHRPDDRGLAEIEFVEGDLSDGFDVEFAPHTATASPAGPDPGSRRRLRSWWIAGGVLALVLGIVVVGALTGGENQPEVASTSTRPSATTATRTTATRITVPRPTESPTTATFVRIVPSTYPPFVPSVDPSGSAPTTVSLPEATTDLADINPAGTTLYLWDTASGPTTLVAMDMTTGVLTPVNLGPVSGPLRAVIPTEFGPIVDAGQVVHVTESGPVVIGIGDASVTDFSRTGARVAGGMSGPVWVRSLEPSFISDYDPASRGNDVGSVSIGFDIPPGVELIGTTAGGDPIVRGPDLQAFELVDGRAGTPFGEGITTPVENGRYAEVDCGNGVTCSVTIHGVFGDATTFSYEVPDNLDRTSVRISPSGEFAAIAVDDNVRIVNTTTGTGTTVPLSYLPSSSDAANRPVANYFRLARDLVWAGPYLLMPTPDGIVVVRIDGTPLTRLVLDADDPLRYVPMAIG